MPHMKAHPAIIAAAQEGIALQRERGLATTKGAMCLVEAVRCFRFAGRENLADLVQKVRDQLEREGA